MRRANGRPHSLVNVGKCVHTMILLFLRMLFFWSLAEGIILPEGAHLQSLSPGESARLAIECGISSETMLQGRRHPWAVSFMTKGRNRLGGTIISPWHILTVAHGFLRFDTRESGQCEVYGYRTFETVQRSWSVVYGDDCIWHQNNDYLCAKPNLTSNRIRAIFIDDGFADGGCIRGHDWAIVELQEPIKFSTRVQPICLPHPNLPISDGEVLTVTSWGRRDAFHKGDPLIREIPMRHDVKCKGRPWMDNMPTDVADYLCAKALDPKDYRAARTCHGDSGSGMERRRPLAGTVAPRATLEVATSPAAQLLLQPTPVAAIISRVAKAPSTMTKASPATKAPPQTTSIHPQANSTLKSPPATHPMTQPPISSTIIVPKARVPPRRDINNSTNNNGTVLARVLVAAAAPKRIRRRSAKAANSRHVMRSPVRIPQLELMRQWPAAKRRDQSPKGTVEGQRVDEIVRLGEEIVQLLSKVKEEDAEEKGIRDGRVTPQQPVVATQTGEQQKQKQLVQAVQLGEHPKQQQKQQVEPAQLGDQSKQKQQVQAAQPEEEEEHHQKQRQQPQEVHPATEHQLMDNSARTELAGLTSFGSRQCGADELARFTRIGNYVEKICALTGVCYPLAGARRAKS